MLQTKYREQIFHQTKKQLIRKLHQQVYPTTHVSLISQVRSSEPAISEQVHQYLDDIIPQCQLNEFNGSKDQVSAYMSPETNRLVDDLYPDALLSIINQLKLVLPNNKSDLFQDREKFGETHHNLAVLRGQILNHEVGQADFWVGCDVAVLPCIQNDLVERNFYQVSTNGNQLLARHVGWLYRKLLVALEAHINHISKYTIYYRLTEAVDQQLKKGVLDTITILLAVMDAAEAYCEESRDEAFQHFDRRQAQLAATEQFISGT